MLSLNFKRSHSGDGGNTANFDFVWLLAKKPGGLSTWVLRLSNLAKSQGPLLWRRGGKWKNSGNRGWAPGGRHHSSKPPPQGDGGEISTFSTNEGPLKQWTLGTHTEHCAVPGTEAVSVPMSYSSNAFGQDVHLHSPYMYHTSSVHHTVLFGNLNVFCK